MSNIKKFEELLRSDKELQAKLAEAAKVFTGDKADGRAVFDAIIAPIATELGLPFSYEEATMHFDSCDLSDEELEAVAGGDGACYNTGGTCYTVGDACTMYYGGPN